MLVRMKYKMNHYALVVCVIVLLTGRLNMGYIIEFVLQVTCISLINEGAAFESCYCSLLVPDAKRW